MKLRHVLLLEYVENSEKVQGQVPWCWQATDATEDAVSHSLEDLGPGQLGFQLGF